MSFLFGSKTHLL